MLTPERQGVNYISCFLQFSKTLIRFRKSHKISADLHKPIKSCVTLKMPRANIKNRYPGYQSIVSAFFEASVHDYMLDDQNSSNITTETATSVSTISNQFTRRINILHGHTIQDLTRIRVAFPSGIWY